MGIRDWQEQVESDEAPPQEYEVPRRGIVVGVLAILAAVFILMGVSYTAIEITKPSAVREVEYIRANKITADEAQAARDLAEASKLKAEAGAYQGFAVTTTSRGILDTALTIGLVVFLAILAVRIGVVRVGRKW